VPRLVVIVPLADGGAEAPSPAGDVDATEFERYSVFRTAGERIFVFEGSGGATKLDLDAMSASGAPSGADYGDAVTFAPTPGPGDSDGGDIYAP
jgi:hypothetical protein